MIYGERNSMKMKNKSLNDKTLGLYLHFPFCVEKCKYCDFLSFGGWSKTDMEAYCRAMIREIEYVGKEKGKGYVVDSVFLGGGTPSLIDEGLMGEVVHALRENFNVAGDLSEGAGGLEFSIEANPKTLTERKLKAYKAMGINRLSMGVQSLNDDLLRFMGRIHTKADFMANYDLARVCGFDNINVDLMFAIPGQTLEIWLDTVDQMVNLGPEHISFYSLQLEEGTPFYELYEKGELTLLADEADREMYHQGLTRLKETGYQHYEISNSAKPGFASKHNLKYWSMGEYLGLGLGAHSYINGIRRSNETSLNAYHEIGRRLATAESEAEILFTEEENPFVVEHHENLLIEDMAEYLFMGLRKREGIDLKDFEGRFERPAQEVYKESWPAIEKYIAEGYLNREGHRLCLTEKGIDISNVILAEFV